MVKSDERSQTVSEEEESEWKKRKNMGNKV